MQHTLVCWKLHVLIEDQTNCYSIFGYNVSPSVYHLFKGDLWKKFSMFLVGGSQPEPFHTCIKLENWILLLTPGNSATVHGSKASHMCRDRGQRTCVTFHLNLGVLRPSLRNLLGFGKGSPHFVPQGSGQTRKDTNLLKTYANIYIYMYIYTST